jgi:uncharacterized protein DUF6916
MIMTKPASFSPSRRVIVATLAVGVAALGAVAAPALNRTWFRRDGRGSGDWWSRQFVSLESAGLNEWSAQVGSEFRAASEAGTTAFKLVDVKALPSAGARPDAVSRDRAFVAVFDAGAAALPPGDRIYAVDHRAGAMKIFFSAAGAGTRIEAVFN